MQPLLKFEHDGAIVLKKAIKEGRYDEYSDYWLNLWEDGSDFRRGYDHLSYNHQEIMADLLTFGKLCKLRT